MKKILVLDDNLDILNIVEEVLAYEHFTVQGISNCSDFVEHVSDFMPDLVLLDYRLTDGNGLDLCHQLKSNPLLNQIPVIIFSAYPLKDADLGDCDYEAIIPKPFDITDLVDKINAILTSHTV